MLYGCCGYETCGLVPDMFVPEDALLLPTGAATPLVVAAALPLEGWVAFAFVLNIEELLGV